MENRLRIQELFQQQNYAAAESLLTQSIVTEPGDSRLILARAGARIQLQRYEEALSDAYYALALNPYDFEAHSVCGLAFWKTGRREIASSYYEAAIHFGDSSFPTLLNYGNLLRERQLFADAISIFQAAMAAEPNHPQAGIAAIAIDLCETARKRQR